LLLNGYKIGVSSRGVGSVEQKLGQYIVGDDFELICWDVVSDPSTSNAWITTNGEEALQQYVENGKPGTTTEITLESCTGSGKTIILTHFMDEFLHCHDKTVFVWFTPGKGNLEEQSKKKMDAYIHGRTTKLLSDDKNYLSIIVVKLFFDSIGV
jgi:hypothetical protein